MEKRDERVPPVDTSLSRWYPLKELFGAESPAFLEGSPSSDGANYHMISMLVHAKPTGR
jgi:hypothetical protein